MARVTRRRLLKLGGLAAAGALGAWCLELARSAAPPLLRPPGAGDEARFLSACIRCGQCVEACPTAILELAHGDAGVASGTPFLVARDKPCNLCQGHDAMRCIDVCPTGALADVARREDVAMGVAAIDVQTCLPFHGVACRACWHACPFPGDAIDLDPLGRPRIVDDRCVGCGLCEHACLTDPPALRVRSREALRRDGASGGIGER